MPEAQLTEPLDRHGRKRGFEEMFAALEAAVKADVEAFLRRGNVNAQDFETLLRPFTVERSPRRAAVKTISAPRSTRLRN